MIYTIRFHEKNIKLWLLWLQQVKMNVGSIVALTISYATIAPPLVDNKHYNSFPFIPIGVGLLFRKEDLHYKRLESLIFLNARFCICFRIHEIMYEMRKIESI